jgi:hypothetical protein
MPGTFPLTADDPTTSPVAPPPTPSTIPPPPGTAPSQTQQATPPPAAPNAQMGALPPPPGTDPAVPKTRKEKIFGVIGSILAGRGGEGSVGNTISGAVGQEYQNRINQAKLHAQNFSQIASILVTGIDPATGQPLTPDQRTEMETLYESEYAAYAKLTGVNKQTKDAVSKKKAFLDHFVHAGKNRQQQQAKPGAMPPPPAGSSPAPAANSPAMPPPPGMVATMSPSPQLQQLEADNEDIRKAQEMAKARPGAFKQINYVGPDGKVLEGTESGGVFRDAQGNPIPGNVQAYVKPTNANLRGETLADGTFVWADTKTGEVFNPARGMAKVENPVLRPGGQPWPKETSDYTTSVDSDGNVSVSRKSSVTGPVGGTATPASPAAGGGTAKPKTAAVPASSSKPSTVAQGGKARENEYKNVINDFKTKLGMLQSDVKTAGTQNATHYILKPGGDVEAGKKQLADMQRAVDFLISEQEDVRTGAVSMQQVQDAANKIAAGAPTPKRVVQ